MTTSVTAISAQALAILDESENATRCIIEDDLMDVARAARTPANAT
jgi:hypothetical protein